MAQNFSDESKDYGLPKVEPQPIQRNQPVAPEGSVLRAQPENKKKDNKLLIIVISVVAILILSSIIYMVFWGDDNPREYTPETQPTEDRVVMEPEPDEAPETTAEVSESELDSNPVVEEPGSIITISQRTNRYYIFVGSYKFRAYAQRHAEKLAADGFAVKLITPDNWVGMRVAVGNYGNEAEASNDAQQVRNRYGTEVVISKY